MKVSEKDTFLHSIATFHSVPNRQPVAGNLKQILNYFKQLLKKKELFPLQGKIFDPIKISLRNIRIWHVRVKKVV